jgi:hypothetical protein
MANPTPENKSRRKRDGEAHANKPSTTGRAYLPNSSNNPDRLSYIAQPITVHNYNTYK